MADDFEVEAAVGEPEVAADTAPSALAIALDGARHDPGLREDIRGFLANQNRLIADQRHHLGEQLRHLKLKYFTDRLKAVLQAFTVLFGALVLSGVGLIVWQAMDDRSLVVEPFGAPPDFAARGLRGEVLSAELLDRLQTFDRTSQSIRPARTYRTSWSDDIKIELPETKVSLGELRGYLRDWLGHPTHVTGDVWREGAQLHLTVRVGERTISVNGPDGDLGVLLDRAAEQVFGETQLYRYSKWLDNHNRNAEALAVARTLAASPDVEERKWALREVCVEEAIFTRFRPSAVACDATLRIEPGNPQALLDRSAPDLQLGWTERAVTDVNGAIEGLRRPRQDFVEEARVAYLPLLEGIAAELSADPARAEQAYRAALQAPNFQSVHDAAQIGLANALAQRHDLVRARAALAGLETPMEADFRWAGFGSGIQPEWAVPGAAGDHAAALAALDRYEAALAKAGDTTVRTGVVRAERARLYAKMGRLDEAQALANQTPTDCYPCLRARGKVAAARGDWAGAEHWFAEAARQGPSLPFAHEELGEARLAHGDLGWAEAAFREAARRAPNWADPFKGLGDTAARRGAWSEALSAYDKALLHAPVWLELKQARFAAVSRR